jgi:hypothetical protein
MFVGVVGTFALALGLIAAGPAQAQNGCTSTTLDLTGYSLTNPCNGEVITLTSGEQTVTFCSLDQGHASVQFGIRATGLGDQGNTYLVYAHQIETSTANAQDLYEFNVIAQVNFISKGSAPNVMQHCSVRITATPSGQINMQPLGCTTHCNG